MLKKSIVLSLTLATVLHANETKLEESVITAKTNQTLANTPASFTIISGKDIQSMSQNSIEGILQNSVGIFPTVNDSSIGGRKALSIRGMSSNHTLILLNGKRISGTDAQIGHSNFQYNWVPLDAIEKIEVIRGPMSSLYGSKGLGGVVNIITKPVENGVHGSINAEASKVQGKNSGNEYALGADIRARAFDKLDMFLSLEKRDIKASGEENNSTITHREGKDIVNALLDFDYHIDDTSTLSAEMLFGKEDRNTKETKKSYSIKKRHYALGYKKQFEDFGISLNAYRTKSDSHTKTFKYTHRLKDDIFNTEIDTDTIENNYLVVGAEYRKEFYHKDYDSAEKKKRNFKNDISYFAAYAQDEINLTDSLLLTLGLRFDKHENFGLHVSPKAYFVYTLNDMFHIKAGYGNGFNAPTVTQSSANYKFVNPFARHAFYGNSDLKPESSNNFELGFEYFAPNRQLEVMGFYNKIKDLIGSKTIGSMPNYIPGMGDIYIHKYSNIGRAKTYGLEVSWKHQNVIDSLDYNLGYTYTRAKDDDNDEDLTLKPRHKINAQLKYRFPYDISTSLALQHIGVQDADVVVDVGNKRKVVRKTLGGYTLAGIQASKTFPNGFKLSLGVENLFDKQLNDEYNYNLRRRYFYGRISYSF